MLRLAHDRRHANIRVDWHRRADSSRPRAHGAGPEPRRRVRRKRHVSERSGGREASRLLLQLSVRDAHWRSAVRDSRTAAPSAGISHARTAAGLGLAHSVRRRRAAGGHGAVNAAQPARDGRVRRREEGRASNQLGARARQISARGPARGGAHHGWHHRVLHLHDLHAEIPATVGRAQRHSDDNGDGSFADFCVVPAADLRRALGQNRPQGAPHLVRGHGHAVHDSAPRRAGGGEKRVRRVSADCGRMADRGRLYVDQRSREGRVVSHERAGDRGRTPVRGDRVRFLAGPPSRSRSGSSRSGTSGGSTITSPRSSRPHSSCTSRCATRSTPPPWGVTSRAFQGSMRASGLVRRLYFWILVAIVAGSVLRDRRAGPRRTDSSRLPTVSSAS